MTKKDTLQILNNCIKELESMSQKDFDKKMLQQGSFFDEYSYKENGFSLVVSQTNGWQVLKNGKCFTNTCLFSEQDCIEHIEYCVRSGNGERSDFTYERIT